MMMVVSKRLTIRGFIVSDHGEAAGEFYRTVGPWLAEGRVTARETWKEGLDQAVEAFLDLHRGGNTGKMLVRLADRHRECGRVTRGADPVIGRAAE